METARRHLVPHTQAGQARGPQRQRHPVRGSLLRWIDEEAAIYAIVQLGNRRAVTKYMSEIEFVSSAVEGDLIEMGLTATRFGRTSLTMRAQVRNMITRELILSIDKIVFVSLDENGEPAARLHGDHLRP